MDDSKSSIEALGKALAVVGSQAALARLCEVSHTAVWKWISEKRVLPAEQVLKVESATGVSRHDLRPDLYPREEPPAQPSAGSPPRPADGPAARATKSLEGLQV